MRLKIDDQYERMVDVELIGTDHIEFVRNGHESTATPSTGQRCEIAFRRRAESWPLAETVAPFQPCSSTRAIDAALVFPLEFVEFPRRQGAAHVRMKVPLLLNHFDDLLKDDSKISKDQATRSIKPEQLDEKK